MSDGQSRDLKLADNYNSEIEAASYMQIPNGYGEHVRRITEAAYDTASRLRRKVIEKRSFEEIDNPELLDVEIRNLALNGLQAAIEDASTHIEQAREYETEIGTDYWFGESNDFEWTLSRDARPEKEENFLENYRIAEGHYRSIFEALDQEVEGQNVVEFLEEKYDINLNNILPEVAEPRMNRR
ncbi:hypothetical protein [Candidatus Nanohalovita haloferacivicina]|uniref:hypothetical protein n=1 Tax=Candidatus Nanohalovita haloferacivicina TaxID=2978046 RepID=UPI00325FD517|nr:hypothetical protein HBNXNv_0989 [Candidatus Nanohalobia archaeon BNXNv]